MFCRGSGLPGLSEIFRACGRAGLASARRRGGFCKAIRGEQARIEMLVSFTGRCGKRPGSGSGLLGLSRSQFQPYGVVGLGSVRG